jgi:type I restriction enzyme S subunit
MKTLKSPQSWCHVPIKHLLEPLENGNLIQQGWSPACEKIPASGQEWGVLKTTAIQEGCFLPWENKKLPIHLQPRLGLEIKAGDILMTCAGPRNRCGIATLVKETPPHLLLSGKIYRFRVDTTKIDPAYLEAFLLSPKAKVELDKMKTGIHDSGLNLTQSRFLNLSIPVAPLPKQKRIVAKIYALLSTLDEGIRCLKASKAKYKLLQQAVLDKAFSSCDEEKKLKQLLQKRLSNGYSGKPVPYETAYKVLRLSATTTGVFLESEYKFLDEKHLENQDIWCTPNDILIQRGNTIDYVGTPVLYTGKPGTFIFPDLMTRIRANEYIIHTKFLYYALSSPKVRHYLRKQAKGSTATMPKINHASLGVLPIPFCSKEKQSAIVKNIDTLLSFGTLINTQIENSLKKAVLLRKAILQNAFLDASPIFEQLQDISATQFILETQHG